MLSGSVLKQFRTYLKSQVGHGWSVEGRKSKGRLLTRVSFRYLTGERSVVLLEIDFDADNQDDIVRTVKKLSDLMRERNIELSQAKELLCGGKIDDNDNAGINWKALQDEFINLERGDRRKTTLNGLKLRMERILECFETKPKPRNSEQLFRKYAELHFGESMPKGGMGRKRDMGDIRAFLNWAVLEKKYLAMEWLPITSRQCRKYIGVVSKNAAKTKVRQPVSTRDIEMLLEALERDGEHEMRGLVILYSVFGIRPCEIAKLEIKDGFARVTTLKQNEKTMYEEAEVRTIAPLNLPNLPKEGERILSLYESGKLKFPSRIEKVIAKHNDKIRFKEIKLSFLSLNRSSFFIFTKEAQHLVGGITIANVRRGVAQMGSFGYWIGERFARNGYMTEAVQGTAFFAFDQLALHRIEAACLPSNEASQGVLKNSGFSYEGTARKYLKINGKWRDHMVFSLLREELIA